MSMEEITRAFAADVKLEGDGRTIYGRCVPYDTPTLVADPGVEPYMECWKRGAFRGAVKDPGRTRFNFMHQQTVLDALGRAVSFVESDGGLDGVFRVSAGHVGDHALNLIREGVYRGLSIHAAVPVTAFRLRDGMVERTSARLLHVALCDEPAYVDAQVTAVRTGGLRPGLIEVHAEQQRRRLRFAPTASS